MKKITMGMLALLLIVGNTAFASGDNKSTKKAKKECTKPCKPSQCKDKKDCNKPCKPSQCKS
jgi:hypothetical protein